MQRKRVIFLSFSLVFAKVLGASKLLSSFYFILFFFPGT